MKTKDVRQKVLSPVLSVLQYFYIILTSEKSAVMTTYNFQESAGIEKRDMLYILVITSHIHYCDYIAPFNASKISFY